jgi:hypothetical protein
MANRVYRLLPPAGYHPRHRGGNEVPVSPHHVTKIQPPAREFLARWHQIVAEKNVSALPDMLAEDVEIGAPPYWGVIHGRSTVAHLLGLILETIDGFTYRREWCADRELALEFYGRVGDLDLQGIDLITLGGDGRIRRLDVLMRPVNAVIALRSVITPQMEAFFVAASAAAELDHDAYRNGR